MGARLRAFGRFHYRLLCVVLMLSQIVAAKKLKSAVRDIEFSRSGEELYAICENKALCVYDVESNMRFAQ